MKLKCFRGGDVKFTGSIAGGRGAEEHQKCKLSDGLMSLLEWQFIATRLGYRQPTRRRNGYLAAAAWEICLKFSMVNHQPCKAGWSVGGGWRMVSLPFEISSLESIGPPSYYIGFFFSQFCQVGGPTIIHKRNEPNLARGQTVT
jgi:hypothetical protein